MRSQDWKRGVQRDLAKLRADFDTARSEIEKASVGLPLLMIRLWGDEYVDAEIADLLEAEE